MPDKLKTWLLRQPLFLPIVALALAILSVDSPTIYGRWIAVSLVIILAYFSSKKVFCLTILSALLGIALHYHNITSQQRAISLKHQTVELYGIIDSPPRTASLNYSEATVKVLQGPQKITGSRILAYIPERYEVNEDSVGKKIWLKGTITALSPPKNPLTFDKRKFYYRKGISTAVQVNDVAANHEIAASHRLHAVADTSRRWIRNKLSYGIENSDASKIILAMFLGEKPESGGKIIDDFRYSGTIHVFAVSGLHVMMIGLLCALLLKLCRCPSNIWIPSVIALMFFYAIVTGMRPPAMRASIMSAIVLIAILLLRQPSLPNCLWLSGIIALVWNTHSLFLPGFQLSYAVLIAIAFTGDWWMNRYDWLNYIDPFFPHALLSKRQKGWLHMRKRASETLAVSTSAWFGSSFLIWLYFGLITPLAIIASLPLMFIVFILLSTCCLSLTVSSVSPATGKLINQLNAHTANTAHWISHFFASIPNTRYHSQPWATGERIVIYHIPEGGGAAYLSLGGGILLDAGNSPQFRYEIMPSLRKNGARIDTLIASHPDIRHIQGLIPAMDEFPIKQLIIPSGNTKSSSINEILRIAEIEKISIIRPSKKTYPVAKGISLELIYAPSEENPLADDRTLVFLLHWHSKRILFLNDSGHHFTHWLRNHKNIENITPDVLILGKHTRAGSLPPDILNLINPRVIIATQSHFPPEQSRSPKWITAIEKSGTKIYLLDQSGAVTLTQTNGEIHYQTMADRTPDDE